MYRKEKQRKMKENRKHILIVSLITVAAAALLAVLYIVYLNVFDSVPSGAETQSDTEESDTYTETDYVTTDILLDSETAVDTEPLTPEEIVQAQFDERLGDISEWIETAMPIYKTEAETDETGETVKEDEEYLPYVSFYYKDLVTGYVMAYNAEDVHYTASIIKEPYVLWALKEIEAAAENQEIEEGSKFDLGSIFVYTEDKFKEGSGVIKSSEFGTEYTYLDLFRLAITQSDNVAFAELRNIYGRPGFYAFSEELGVISPKKSFYSLNAREMGAYLEETYKYFESESEYALMLKKWMLSTNHRIMIPRALSPIPVANKYGWDADAYHDAAVVLDDSPYVLVIMTGLDHGTSKDNTFIRELASKIHTAHTDILGEK